MVRPHKFQPQNAGGRWVRGHTCDSEGVGSPSASTPAAVIVRHTLLVD